MAEASGGKATLVFLESSTGGALGVKCLVFVSQHVKDDGQTFMIETVMCSGSRVGEYIECMRECVPSGAVPVPVPAPGPGPMPVPKSVPVAVPVPVPVPVPVS